ncbi:uncharacterized protein LOC143236158 [Tachypleus tridentatus]|uniref:uncharacterized protein LOC143236158 n=1 Tax=Tachypleus tridentatus TaxID=6853 RepID=UPI003FD2D525
MFRFISVDIRGVKIIKNKSLISSSISTAKNPKIKHQIVSLGAIESCMRLILESLQVPVLQEATFCSPALKSSCEDINQDEDITDLVLFLVAIMDECFIPLAMFHATTSDGNELFSSVCLIVTMLTQVDKFLVIPQLHDLFEKLLKYGFLNSLWRFRNLLPHDDVRFL